jgi:hypothetical protein
MKLTTKLSAVIFVLAVLAGAACKKSAVPAAAKTNSVDYKSLASHIVTGLYSSVNVGGVMGGNNLKSNSGRNKVTLSVSSLCGFTIDTTYTIDSTTFYNSKYSSKNSYKLIYTCGSGAVNGYTVADSIINTEIYPNNTELRISRFGAHDTVTALDQTFKLFNLSGKSYSNISETHTAPTVFPATSQSASYLSSGLKIDVSTGQPNITSGITTFKGLQLSGAFSAAFTGKIVYIGNFEAQVIFDNPNDQIHSFTVNILTGNIVSIP